MKRKEIEEDIEKFVSRTFVDALLELGVGDGFVTSLRESFEERSGGEEINDFDLFVSSYITLVCVSLRNFLSGMSGIWFEGAEREFELCSSEAIEGLCGHMMKIHREEYLEVNSIKRRQ